MIFLIIFLLSVLLFSQANATDYYVRPTGGSYGAGDGTSYANAWSGFSAINWTTVDNGNGTLWVAGTNNEAMTVGDARKAGNADHHKRVRFKRILAKNTGQRQIVCYH